MKKFFSIDRFYEDAMYQGEYYGVERDKKQANFINALGFAWYMTNGR